jgi:YegS/Rv2252/BmrU family lipid kinase
VPQRSQLSTKFLVNPASANRSTGQRWPEIHREAATRGLTGDALFSERPGHLTELARQAADDGASLLVLPRGTGCDFVRTYGIPHRLAGAIDVALSGPPRAIDLGRVRYRSWAGGEAESWFANVASAGMSGAIAQRANETTKALGGKASYLWATLAVFARWRVGSVRVDVDGEVREGRMHDVVVANGRYFGGGMMICPEASSDDGRFDVLLIGDLTKRDLLLTLPKTYRGTHLPHPKAELLRGAAVTIDGAQPLPIQLDGEQPGTTPARLEVVPRALRVRVPA